MFQPPRCPNRACTNHLFPAPKFYAHHGSFKPKCRPWSVPRYRCKTCKKTFSRQTFRMDYRDHRPDLNIRLFRSLASGVGVRQTARNLQLSLSCTELKYRKIARHLRRQNLNLRGPLPKDSELVFDELETYETRRNTRPLSIPILVERKHRYVIWAEAAPIRPRGKMSKDRKSAVEQENLRFGPRKDTSARSIARVLKRGADLVRNHEKVTLLSDEKSSYPKHARKAFGAARLVHKKTNSKVARMIWNPLFPVNHEEAMMRDLLGRLRRESWLVSKKRRYLDLGLHLWMAYRNYVRKRFNRDTESPAQMLGFVSRRLSFGEALSWRQDWGKDSIHPLSR
ncbi:MAG: transposase-like protein, partial [Planctomycetota bacterium]